MPLPGVNVQTGCAMFVVSAVSVKMRMSGVYVKVQRSTDSSIEAGRCFAWRLSQISSASSRRPSPPSSSVVYSATTLQRGI